MKGLIPILSFTMQHGMHVKLCGWIGFAEIIWKFLEFNFYIFKVILGIKHSNLFGIHSKFENKFTFKKKNFAALAVGNMPKNR